jgi:alpha-soluble NSF attachment protein
LLTQGVQAERKEAPSSRISSWFSGGDDDRYEEAAELYTQAANMYKIQKDSRYKIPSEEYF